MSVFIAFELSDPALDAHQVGNHITLAYAGKRSHGEVDQIVSEVSRVASSAAGIEFVPDPDNLKEFGDIEVVPLKLSSAHAAHMPEFIALRDKWLTAENKEKYPKWNPHITITDSNRDTVKAATVFKVKGLTVFRTVPRALQAELGAAYARVM